MLMEQFGKETPRGLTAQDDSVFFIKNEPVMQSALEVLTRLPKKKMLTLRARGESIPNAVAVANIITEKMLHGNSKIDRIHLDSEMLADGRMISTIEIILKTN